LINYFTGGAEAFYVYVSYVFVILCIWVVIKYLFDLNWAVAFQVGRYLVAILLFIYVVYLVVTS